MLRKSLIAAAALAALAPALAAADDDGWFLVRDANGNCQVTQAAIVDPEDRIGGPYNSYPEANLAVQTNPLCDGF